MLSEMTWGKLHSLSRACKEVLVAIVVCISQLLFIPLQAAFLPWKAVSILIDDKINKTLTDPTHNSGGQPQPADLPLADRLSAG